MSEQERNETPAEDEEAERLEDLEPGEEDSDALRGGVLPPDT